MHSLMKNKKTMSARYNRLKDPCDDTYRGPRPRSEPEVQHITKYIMSQKPVIGLIDFHCYSQVVLFPYGKVECIMKLSFRHHFHCQIRIKISITQCTVSLCKHDTELHCLVCNSTTIYIFIYIIYCITHRVYKQRDSTRL